MIKFRSGKGVIAGDVGEAPSACIKASYSSRSRYALKAGGKQEASVSSWSRSR
jgi:hypothetical protein